jgi:hypothetical protein
MFIPPRIVFEKHVRERLSKKVASVAKPTLKKHGCVIGWTIRRVQQHP